MWIATPYNTNRHLQNESIRVSKDKVVRRWLNLRVNLIKIRLNIIKRNTSTIIRTKDHSCIKWTVVYLKLKQYEISESLEIRKMYMKRVCIYAAT